MKKIIILALCMLLLPVVSNGEDIRELERKAYNSKNTYAQFRLGKIYLEQGKLNAGMSLLNEACSGGEKEACDYLKQPNVSVNTATYSSPIEELTRKATAGDPKSQYLLGKELIKRGDYTGRNWIERACKNNYITACSEVGSSVNTSERITPTLPYVEVKKSFNKAKDLYDNKKFYESFRIFERLCLEADDYPSCLYLARSYSFGHGTAKNVNKALDIYKQNREKHDAFKLEEAMLWEYEEGLTNKAYDVYRQLQNSNIDWVAKEAKEGCTRIPVYKFLEYFLYNDGAFYSKRIDYNKFYNNYHSIDTRDISSELRNAFYPMRESCLKAAKNDDGYWEDVIWNTGKTFVKAFVGGIPGIVDGVIDGFSIGGKYSDDLEDCKRKREQFFNALNKENISGKWFSTKQELYYPKNK